MSLVQNLKLWMRRSLTWSNSSESWSERRAAWSLVATAIALVLLVALRGRTLWTRASGAAVKIPDPPDWLLFALGCIWLVAALVLMRLGLVKLFGPVLFYDMVRAARRSRYFLLRGFYSLVLLLILFFVWMTVSETTISARERASRLAMDYFEIFSVVQLVAVMLLTPAYVAGAISEEKDRKTLEFLLATDLRNREIVLSKLLSRFANLAMFLLTGLPILSLLQFLGGIDPNLVFAGLAFTAITMVGIGGISILNSVFYKRPRDSIAVSYFFLIAYMLLTTVFFQWQPPAAIPFSGGIWPSGSIEAELVEWVYTGNIFVLLIKVFRSGSAGTLSADLPGMMGEYAVFWGVIAAVCTVWAVVRLRRIALKQNFARVKLSQQAKDRPPVGELPMIWKEIHVEGSLRLNWLAWGLILLLVVATFANPFIWLVEWSVIGSVRQHDDLSEMMNVWARIAGTAVGCLTILGVAIRAANSIGSERDRQTMDGLLSTPLDSTSILIAKFIGSLCSIRLGLVWLICIYVVALATGGLNVFAFPLVLAAWFVLASVAAVIGLSFSMSSHTTLRATIYTVMTCVLLGVGHWLIWLFCGPMLFLMGNSSDAAEWLAKFQTGVTPPAMLVLLTFQGYELGTDFGDRVMTELVAFSIFGMFLWALAGLFYWNGILLPRFRTLLGRVESFRPSLPRQRGLPPPVPLPSIEGDASAVGTSAD